MTDIAAANGHLPVRPRYEAPIPCPHAMTRPIDGSSAPTEERLEDLEAAALLRAFDAGNAALLAAQSQVNAACDAVVRRFHDAQRMISRLAWHAATGAVVRARRAVDAVYARHADDGAEDRRRRRFPPGLDWAVVSVAAVFDGAFVGNVVQRIFSVGPDSVMYYLAYLPGVGMALCLFAAGTSLAEHLFRRRNRVGRQLVRRPVNPALLLRRLFWDWRTEPVRRAPDDLPWSRLPVPVLFTALIVALLAAGAAVRVSLAAQRLSTLSRLQPVFVILLLLLSIAAIAVKVLAHNPYADSDKRAAKQLRSTEKVCDQLSANVAAAVAAQAQAWVHLQSTLATAEGDARRIVEEACARMLDERGHRGKSGPLRLPLTVLRWPADDQSGAQAREAKLPGLNLAVLDHAREILEKYRPDQLEDGFRQALEAYRTQFGPRHERGAGAPETGDAARGGAWDPGDDLLEPPATVDPVQG